jgi:hypothetical protein
MSVGTLARYATVSGLSVPVSVVANGRDKYGPVTVLRVTSTARGQRAYRKGDVFTVSADSVGLSVR